jgi:hypothetical protein
MPSIESHIPFTGRIQVYRCIVSTPVNQITTIETAWYFIPLGTVHRPLRHRRHLQSDRYLCFQ